MFNSLYFFFLVFEKHVLSEVLKDFSVENLKTATSTVRSIYLELLIIEVVFLHYTEREFDLCFIRISAYFFFFFFFFYRYFP